MIIQFCGMSGSGKSTLAQKTKENLSKKNVIVEIIDGDEYRNALCSDLGFSKTDRNLNIRRLAFVANKFASFGIIPIICAINPYEKLRQEIIDTYEDVRTIFINCNIDELILRDTKGLYKKAMLPDNHPDKITNLTGVNDPFDIPQNPDLVINTDVDNIQDASDKIAKFILSQL